LSGDRAASLSPNVAEKADVILARTKSHKDSVLEKASAVADKVLTICEYAGTAGEVPIIGMGTANDVAAANDPGRGRRGGAGRASRGRHLPPVISAAARFTGWATHGGRVCCSLSDRLDRLGLLPVYWD
jgi:hypothetical protein